VHEPDPTSRRQKIRKQVLNRTMGRWIRVVDLLLEHHTDEGLPVDREAEAIAKRAVILMVGHMLTEEDAVMLLESSRMRLPKKLEESSEHDIRRWIEGTDREDELGLELKRDERPAAPQEPSG
jgi:hypothetical protein